MERQLIRNAAGTEKTAGQDKVDGGLEFSIRGDLPDPEVDTPSGPEVAL